MTLSMFYLSAVVVQMFKSLVFQTTIHWISGFKHRTLSQYFLKAFQKALWMYRFITEASPRVRGWTLGQFRSTKYLSVSQFRLVEHIWKSCCAKDSGKPTFKVLQRLPGFSWCFLPACSTRWTSSDHTEPQQRAGVSAQLIALHLPVYIHISESWSLPVYCCLFFLLLGQQGSSFERAENRSQTVTRP